MVALDASTVPALSQLTSRTLRCRGFPRWEVGFWITYTRFFWINGFIRMDFIFFQFLNWPLGVDAMNVLYIPF